MVVGSLVQYHFCLRIYNRFQFDGMFVDHWGLNETDRRVADDTDLSNSFGNEFDTGNHSAPDPVRGVQEDKTADDGSVDSRRSRNSAARERGMERKGILKNLLSRSHGRDEPSEEHSVQKALPTGKVFKQGYVSLRSSQVSLLWTRYYFVLKGTNMWYYKDRPSFEKEPTSTMITRPIDMMHYSPSLISGSPPYRLGLKVNGMGLQAKVKDWEFTVDTLEELNEWMSVLSAAALQASLGNKHANESTSATLIR